MNVCICYYDPDVTRGMYLFDADEEEVQELRELAAMDESPGGRTACRARVGRLVKTKAGTNLNFMKVREVEIFHFCF